MVTGDVWTGGTNANVFIQIYGEEGKTELITLKSRSNNYERGTTDIFKVMTNIYFIYFSHTYFCLLSKLTLNISYVCLAASHFL